MTRHVSARPRQLAKASLDAAVLAVAFFSAYALRFDFEIPAAWYDTLRASCHSWSRWSLRFSGSLGQGGVSGGTSVLRTCLHS